jgi:16S rRNA (cytosine1402-N4)-methyltransferase
MNEPVFRHTSVLLREVLEAAPTQPRRLLDCTLGGAGHARALLEHFPNAHLHGIDRDAVAVTAATHRLASFQERCTLEQASFADLRGLLSDWNLSFDFVLADIGMSSEQLADAERGFSFLLDGPLDMRMDPSSPLPNAAHIVNQWSEFDLRRLLQVYGEERFAPQIARAIGQRREKQAFSRTLELAEFVEQIIPRRFHKPHFHPATLTFQALRIEVNQELAQLEALLREVPAYLNPAGHLAIISFHSLEDRLVKQTFRRWESPCTCPPDMPHCVCGNQPLGRSLQRKPITATEAEIRENPRSRSARLRVFVRNDQPWNANIGVGKHG